MCRAPLILSLLPVLLFVAGCGEATENNKRDPDKSLFSFVYDTTSSKPQPEFLEPVPEIANVSVPTPNNDTSPDTMVAEVDSSVISAVAAQGSSDGYVESNLIDVGSQVVDGTIFAEIQSLMGEQPNSNNPTHQTEDRNDEEVAAGSGFGELLAPESPTATVTNLESETELLESDDSQGVASESELLSSTMQTSSPPPPTSVLVNGNDTPNPIDSLIPTDTEILSEVSEAVFPGAEGFGIHTRAGKDGAICRVTQLGDTGVGSLRSCVESHAQRTVIFDVSGTIVLKSTLTISSPYISILGQTAPNSGVMVTVDDSETGPVIRVVTHDVLIQHMRIRAGSSKNISCCRDALSIGTEVPGQVFNVIIDHNSLSWGTDEIIDIEYDSRDITVSYNIIAEGLHRSSNNDGPAGRGMLIGHRANNISIHHNVFANTYQRNPSIRGIGVTDFVNNIVYHAVSRGTQVEARNGPNKVNLVKNLYIPHLAGQIQPSNTNWFDVLITLNENNTFDPDLSIYMNGNLGFWRTDQNEPEWKIAGIDWATPYDPSIGVHTNERHWAPPVTEYETELLEMAILENVGATLPIRDSVDQRVISELLGRTGSMPDCVDGCDRNAGGWPTLY